jgi:hypothetical protein
MPSGKSMKSRAAQVCRHSVLMFAAAGCAAETEPDDAYAHLDSAALDAGRSEAATIGGPDARVRLPDVEQVLREPDGAWTATIVSDGTGCPPGTSNAQLHSDGKTVRLTFSAFEAAVSPAVAVSVKNCQTEVVLRAPRKLSFAVDELFFGGYGFLEPAIEARQTAAYGFRGSASARPTLFARSVGPFDDFFELRSETLAADQLAWSPCGSEAQLTVATAIRLINASPRGHGYMNSSCLVDGCRASFRLRWRTCEA